MNTKHANSLLVVLTLSGLVAVTLWGPAPLDQASRADHAKPEGTGQDHSPLRAQPAGLRYPKGSKLVQRYASAEGAALPAGATGIPPLAAVRSFLLEHQAADQPKFKLAPRSATIFKVKPAAAAAAGPQKFLGNYEFEVLTSNDIPIAKASRSLVVQGQKAIAIRNRNVPDKLEGLGELKKTVKEEDAYAAGLQNAKEAFAKLYPGKYAILTIDSSDTVKPRLEIWFDDQKAPHLTLAFGVRSTNRLRPFLRQFWVEAAGAPKVLDYEDRIFHEEAADGDSSGTVTGTVFKVSPFGDLDQRKPFKSLLVTLERQGQKTIATTDKAGKYVFPGMGGNVIISAKLEGRFCRIINDEQDGGLGDVFSLAKPGQGAIDLDFQVTDPKLEFKLAQLNAYYWVNEAHDFVKDFLPDVPQKLLSVPTHVNINDSCNAFWDPTERSLNFFRKTAGSCPNTAYRDVILHEYGHGIDDELGGILDGGYSEGFGDSIAILYTRSPIVGHDFFGQNQHLRDASQKVLWPSVMDGEVHEQGRPYGGFVWELTQQLKAKYQASLSPSAAEDRAFEVAKSLILGAAVHNPSGVPDAVRWSFYVDAQLNPTGPGKPSAHFDQLKAAAQSRQIPLPPNPMNPLAGP